MSELITAPKPATPAFKVGDKVTWTHTRQNGAQFNFSVREGKITELVGTRVARVKMRNGRMETKHLNDLTPADQQNELTRALTGVTLSLTPPKA